MLYHRTQVQTLPCVVYVAHYNKDLKTRQ